MATGFYIDIVLLCVLAVVLVYAFRLSRQFSHIQDDQKQLETLIIQLNKASERAENAVQAMRESAVESGELLQEKINVSRTLIDELEIMIEAGDSLAGRLQVLAERSRKAAQEGEATPAGPARKPAKPAPAAKKEKTALAEDAPELQGKSRAERELIEALRTRQE